VQALGGAEGGLPDHGPDQVLELGEQQMLRQLSAGKETDPVYLLKVVKELVAGTAKLREKLAKQPACKLANVGSKEVGRQVSCENMFADAKSIRMKYWEMPTGYYVNTFNALGVGSTLYMVITGIFYAARYLCPRSESYVTGPGWEFETGMSRLNKPNGNCCRTTLPGVLSGNCTDAHLKGVSSSPQCLKWKDVLRENRPKTGAKSQVAESTASLDVGEESQTTSRLFWGRRRKKSFLNKFVSGAKKFVKKKVTKVASSAMAAGLPLVIKVLKKLVPPRFRTCVDIVAEEMTKKGKISFFQRILNANKRLTRDKNTEGAVRDLWWGLMKTALLKWFKTNPCSFECMCKTLIRPVLTGHQFIALENYKGTSTKYLEWAKVPDNGKFVPGSVLRALQTSLRYVHGYHKADAYMDAHGYHKADAYMEFVDHDFTVYLKQRYMLPPIPASAVGPQPFDSYKGRPEWKNCWELSNKWAKRAKQKPPTTRNLETRNKWNTYWWGVYRGDRLSHGPDGTTKVGVSAKTNPEAVRAANGFKFYVKQRPMKGCSKKEDCIRCELKVNVFIARCTGCHCPDGLVISVIQSKLTDDPNNSKKENHCKVWGTFVDSVFRAGFAIVRAFNEDGGIPGVMQQQAKCGNVEDNQLGEELGNDAVAGAGESQRRRSLELGAADSMGQGRRGGSVMNTFGSLWFGGFGGSNNRAGNGEEDL